MQIRRYNISVLENETGGNIEPAPAALAALAAGTGFFLVIYE